MTENIPTARSLRPAGSWSGEAEAISLDYDQRLLRRRRLVTASGLAFLVDLDGTTSINPGDALVLEDGRLVEVLAADEPLYEIHAHDLTRLAWHIGNRHTPCQIEPGRLLIRQDHVLGDMVHKLGGHVHEIMAPFHPEGGAYGHGRTMGHSHDATPHHHHGAAHVHHHGSSHSPAHVHHHGSHSHDEEEDAAES